MPSGLKQCCLSKGGGLEERRGSAALSSGDEGRAEALALKHSKQMLGQWPVGCGLWALPKSPRAQEAKRPRAEQCRWPSSKRGAVAEVKGGG